MTHKGKILITDEGQYDLGAATWDDEQFSDVLIKTNPIGRDAALDISRFAREEIGKIESETITLPMLEQIIEAKLNEFGLSRTEPLNLNQLLFGGEDLELSENAVTVLERRYLKKDADGNPIETPWHMFRRVAGAVAGAESAYGGKEAVEEMTETFYKMMTELRFLPNSPTLMNAGRELGQLAACFVLPVEDSMEGIFDALKNAALIHKSGGGTGFSFSRLRPKESRVGSTGGVASGPVSFMRIFNTATEQVKQGGTRRGANMAIMRVDHPDILEFIECKKNHAELNNFNISVAVTDHFMEAVENDETYDLINPNGNHKTGELNARDVYNLLVENAWDTGDPGIVFIDRINRDNPTPAIGEIESTNPCVTGDTFIMTAHGGRQVKELLDTESDLLVNGKIVQTGKKGFFPTGIKPVFKLRTREGYQLRLTRDHKVLRAASVTRKRVATEWCRAETLSPGDKILLHNHSEYLGWEGAHNEKEGYLLGLLVGDGTLKKDKATLSVWRKAANGETEFASDSVMERALDCAFSLPHRSDFKGWQAVGGRSEFWLSLAAVKQLALELGMQPGNKGITPAMERCSSAFYCGFLAGFFDADGSVQGNQEKGASVRLSQSDLPRLQAAQRMLLRLGIVSRIYKNRRYAQETLLPDGRGGVRAFPTRPQHELVISNDNLFRFEKRIGFQDRSKQEKLATLLKNYQRAPNRERFLATVETLEPDGKEAVFDVQVPGVNAFDANGVYVHNCGEQPLLPMEACNLGSINLAKFVTKGEEGSELDYDALGETVHDAVRFLDNIIDVARYPLPEITELVRGNRKIGLGVMGFADLLFHLGVGYNTDKALETAADVMQFIQKTAHTASRELAKERGPFKNFSRSIFAGKKNQRYRNATTTTIAPTGTLSIIANCSSGIEPLFALSFVRNVMDNDKLLEVNPLFEKVAKERGFYSKELMNRIAEAGTIAHMDEIPDDVKTVFVTAHDITPQWHVKMQAVFQEQTDNAVSKTVNLPRDATIEDVRKVYDLAFELSCKGVTIYRDGSKANQVLSVGKTASAEDTFMAAVKSRPEVLPGFTHRIKTGMGMLYVTITEYEGRPFEVFATIGKSGRSTTAKTEAIGRLVSLALRSGIDVKRIVTQLKGIGGEHPVFQEGGMVLSIPDAISKVLEIHYLKEGVKMGGNSLSGKLCPECGGAVSFEEGCVKCHGCGFTKCG